MFQFCALQLLQAVSELCEFPLYSFYVTLKFTQVRIHPTSTYLSHLISYIYVFTMSVYMFTMLLLSVFHMKYTLNNYGTNKQYYT
jgi:hypothetical protein